MLFHFEEVLKLNSESELYVGLTCNGKGGRGVCRRVSVANIIINCVCIEHLTQSSPTPKRPIHFVSQPTAQSAAIHFPNENYKG